MRNQRNIDIYILPTYSKKIWAIGALGIIVCSSIFTYGINNYISKSSLNVRDHNNSTKD